MTSELVNDSLPETVNDVSSEAAGGDLPETITCLANLMALHVRFGRDCWYRGQTDKDFKLVPGVYREKEYMDDECEMLDEFKHLSLTKSSFRPSDSWGWVVLAQHYGVPTRLLDWSENPLQALYFAVCDADTTKTDGKLFILRPKELNKMTWGNRNSSPRMLRDTDDRLQPLMPEQAAGAKALPVAVVADNEFERIGAQRGVFTIHPCFTLDNNGGIPEEVVESILIPQNAKTQIKRELEFVCIDESTSYPDLDHLGARIKKSHFSPRKTL